MTGLGQPEPRMQPSDHRRRKGGGGGGGGGGGARGLSPPSE